MFVENRGFKQRMLSTTCRTFLLAVCMPIGFLCGAGCDESNDLKGIDKIEQMFSFGETLEGRAKRWCLFWMDRECRAFFCDNEQNTCAVFLEQSNSSDHLSFHPDSCPIYLSCPVERIGCMNQCSVIIPDGKRTPFGDERKH